jgi:hypothetical protein
MVDTIYVGFRNPDTAAKAVGALLDHGVEASSISVLVKDAPASWGNGMTPGEQIEHQANSGITVTTGRDAAHGSAKGAAIGLGIGVLAALAAVTVPGFGLVLGGGALATALGGTVATTAAGAVAGATIGYLKDQGVDEITARAFHDQWEQGGALVSVVASDKVSPEEISGILGKYTREDDLMHRVAWPAPPPVASAMRKQ